MRPILYNLLFLFKRFKTSSILNILGLAIAFTVFFAMVVQTHYDFSFDRNFEKADNIYLCSSYMPKSNSYFGTNTQTPKKFAGKFPEIKNFCYTNPHDWRLHIFEVSDSIGNVHEFNENMIRVSEGFADMFLPGKIIMGDVKQIFIPDDSKAMLTKSIARKFFGNEDPLGKTVVFHSGRGNILVTIAAVCEDFPDNCSFENGVYFNRLEDSEWASGYTTYLEIDPKDKDKLLDAMNKEEEAEQDPEYILLYKLTALPDIHLRFPEKGKGSLNSTLSLLALGLWLMFIAYINFVNFSIAMSPVRLKGFNIRRIFGESPFILKLSVLIESAIISFIAFLISILFIHFFYTGVIKEFFQVDLSVSNNIIPLLLTAITSVIMGILAGLYPAFYLTSFNPAIALTGSFSVSSRSKFFKNTMIIIQFITAVFLIIVAGFIKIQHDYMQNKSLGITTENILYFSMGKLQRDSRKVFESELKNNPDIIDIARSNVFPGRKASISIRTQIDNVEVKAAAWATSPNILKFFNINIVAGHDFEEDDGQGSEKLIFNQTFVTKYGLKAEDLAGKKVPHSFWVPDGETEIVGIMEDFNFQSLHEYIQPMVFAVGKSYTDYMSVYMFIKFNGQNTGKTINYINETWKKFTNENPDICFLDKTLQNLYLKEKNLAKLISICGLITIIVTIMGVYGLILFNAKSKRKTIALHKVHGASIMEVILMLNRGFLIQFAVAYIIAVPVTYYVVNRWLENFAYKTPIHWWVFVFGGLLVFLITVATVSWQSYRAASANPVEALKSE
ncbi:MAG: ABC transporter permease [Bacteroidales bacterium]|jgi:putative ABC transport system permease protein|nr:ABC transporter permease [Bacteroidales bacterium]